MCAFMAIEDDMMLKEISNPLIDFAAGAVEDFSEAIKQMPTYADGWKRRGQARAALEQHEDALEVRHSSKNIMTGRI